MMRRDRKEGRRKIPREPKQQIGFPLRLIRSFQQSIHNYLPILIKLVENLERKEGRKRKVDDMTNELEKNE